MRIEDLDYELPEELIAQEPLPSRTASRLLVVPAMPDEALGHATVAALPQRAGDPSLIVLNDTRVLPARLRGRKATGGRVELLLVAAQPSGSDGEERWTALGRASKGLRPGTTLRFPEEGAPILLAEVVAAPAAADAGLVVVFRSADDRSPVRQALEEAGEVPLPPYVRRAAIPSDVERYQTVYARTPGAVAAPTAGLHLTQALLDELRAAGHEIATVTLHVGPGTFAPLRSQRLDDHVMHAEWFEVPAATADRFAAARQAGRPVIAVGTTVVRTLESAVVGDGSALRVGTGETDLFIRPPYRFRAVDGLLTNFHLPRSTLLGLVMAFRGVERVRAAYEEAVRARYRFFSYGDAMWLPPPRRGGGP